MPKVVVKGESVYKCSVCARSIRVPTNKYGLDVLQRCNITYGCLGKLRRITLVKEINETPAFPPEVQGVQDWFPRRVLYTHEQSVQSATWLVQHNLSGNPKIHTFVNRVVDGVETLVEAIPSQLSIVDQNTAMLYFSTAESGVAQCVGTTSQNTVNPITTQQSAIEPYQLSNDIGEITLATLSDAPLIGIALTYLTAGTDLNITIEYAGIPIVPNATSPWSGNQRCVINGRNYTLRSFNVITTPLAPAYFAANAVPEGARLYVSNFEGAPPSLGECLILLGTSPYATVDKVTTKYVDASDILSTDPQVYYSQEKIFTDVSLLKNTYPPILVV